ncbi:hypothetical protein [Pseudomonas sp. LS-2]|uniref:hypothetical protein n=1 Tax=Pseudomonas sp. LS-2 TaxID=2315859 RepID=UPI001058E50D|nr:hypothetical protein [Pseudomonas sp. LS-2]
MLDFDPRITHMRDQLLESHPIVLRSYFVLTPTIEWAYKQVREQVWLSMPSVYFQSVPRMGKTQCATAIVAILRNDFPNRYVEFVTADIAREETVIHSMVKAIGLVIKSRTNLSGIRDAVIDHVICELASLGSNHFILVIDEMQALDYKDYQHLQVLQNILSTRGLKLTTVGFAQNEIDTVRNSLHAGNYMAILARFLGRKIDFVGCGSVEWLAAILTYFDEGSAYPHGSKCSFTEFFLPKAFHAGFRLVSIADEIYRHSMSCVLAVGAKTIPTEHIFLAMSYLLVGARLKDEEGFAFNEKDIKSAIASSEMSQFAALMSAKPPKTPDDE